MGVRHLTELVGPDNPADDINPTEWNQDHIMDDVSPSTPAAGKLAMLVKSIAGFLFPASINPTAQVIALQPHVASRVYAYQQAQGSNSGDIHLLGASGFDTVGGVNFTNILSTNKFQARLRVDRAQTTASTTAVAGYIENNTSAFNTGANGGFIVGITWGQGVGASNPTKSGYAGLTQSTSALSDVSPASFKDAIGMGYESGDTNCQIFHNDGSTTATKIDLGADFPVPTANLTNFYQIVFYCAPNATSIGYTATNMDTGVEVSGTITTKLPRSFQFLRKRIYTSVGGTSAQTGCSFFSAFHSIG